MRKVKAACVLAMACMTAVALHAEAAGKIVCWKDKSGKVVGCGDSVPPEFQENAAKELDKRGLTRKTIDSSEDVARQRAQAEEAARLRAENDRRAAEQQRQDTALLATYASVEEIDGKRDRDLQVVDMQLDQLRLSLKTAGERQKDAQTRFDNAQKTKKGAPESMREDLARAGDEVKRLGQTIAVKEQEKEAIRARYADYRKRYAELRSGQRSAAAAKR